MAGLNELVPGDYVRWRNPEDPDGGYLFGTVDEVKKRPDGNVEAYITPDGAPEGVQVSRIVNDLVRINTEGA